MSKYQTNCADWTDNDSAVKWWYQTRDFMSSIDLSQMYSILKIMQKVTEVQAFSFYFKVLDANDYALKWWFLLVG